MAQEDYQDIITGASQKYGVPEEWIRAVIKTESGGNPAAIRPEPSKGPGVASRGLMQLMPGTAKSLGFTGDPNELFNPKTNIELGAKYLGQLKAQHGTFERVYSAYNSGDPEAYLKRPDVKEHTANAIRNLQGGGGEDLGIPNIHPTFNFEADRAVLREQARRVLGVDIGAPATATPRQPLTPFSEIAKQLDPMMSKEDYDNIRQGYFFSSVVPHLDPSTNVSAMFEEFKKQTERRPLLNTPQKLGLTANVGLIQAEQEMINPLTPFVPSLAARTKDNQDWLDRSTTLLKREGIDPGMAKTIGQIIGSVPGFEIAGAFAEPVAAALTVNRAYASAKVLNLANRTLHAGLATSAYEVAREQQGGRLINGLKGFGIGATAGMILGLPRFLGREATGVAGPVADEVGNTLAAKIPNGEPLPATLDKKAADWVQNQVDVAKQEGRPAWVIEDPKVKGVMVHTRGRSVGPMPAPERSFIVKVGDETASVNELMTNVLGQGGSIEGISYNPAASESASEFFNILSSKSRGKYEFGTKLLRTEEGAAEAVAQKAQAEGLEATAVSPNTVAVDAYAPVEDIRNRPATMTRERAEQLIKTLGGDPAQVDLDLAMRLNADEIQGVVDFTKELGGAIGRVMKSEVERGVPEKPLTPGQLTEPVERGAQLSVPDFEQRKIDPNASIVEQTDLRPSRNPVPVGKLIPRPTKTRVVVPPEDITALSEGATALTYPRTKDLLDRLGIKPPPAN